MKHCLKCEKQLDSKTKSVTCLPCRKIVCPHCQKRNTIEDMCGVCKGKKRKADEVKTKSVGIPSRGQAGS
jgi:hypothetical protein